MEFFLFTGPDFAALFPAYARSTRSIARLLTDGGAGGIRLGRHHAGAGEREYRADLCAECCEHFCGRTREFDRGRRDARSWRRRKLVYRRRSPATLSSPRVHTNDAPGTRTRLKYKDTGGRAIPDFVNPRSGPRPTSATLVFVLLAGRDL